jgi:Protein O-mannosyl-transferase TMEM260-like
VAIRVLRSQETKISLYAAAAVTLVAGYADLVRGGTTVSALLLSVAYCGLIPLAIWSGAGEPPRDREGRPSYGIAAIAALAVLALYLATMAPSTAMWDTSEYIAAAYTFGLPHPPGNPFFVIIGRVFSILPIASTVAARINVLAAVCSAIAAGVWFLVAEHVVRAWLPARWQRIVAGAFAALIGATAFTVWNQSVVNEKVYTVSLAGIALVSWLAIRWSDRTEGPRADRALVMIAYLCGLGYANHMAGMLPAPAIATVVLLRRPTTLFRWKLLLACLVALFVGVTPFATQPIRAAYHPVMNEGEPTACRERLAWSCTMSKATYDAFMYNFNRGQYGKPNLSDRQASFGEQVGMWWLYFRWQWFRDTSGNSPFTQSLLGASFLVLGLIGAWIHQQRDRKSFWYFGTLMFTMTLLLIYYLNFKLGWSQDQASQADREVRDRDYFFLWSFSAWGVWASVGLMYLWDSVAQLVPVKLNGSAHPPARSWWLTSPVALLAVVPLFGNAGTAPRSRHQATRNVAADMLNSVEPYGVLVTVGDNDTFPLWYAQEVEGVRRDVVVANTSLLNTDWYVRQLLRRPNYGYDAAKGPAIYRDKRWVKPSTPPLRMTFDEADAIPDPFELRQPMLFEAPGIHAIVDPRNLEYGMLRRADVFVLRMIRDSWPERPMYFARSAGGYPRSLGLGDNVLTQGLATKLFVPATGAVPKDTLYVQGDGWLDVPRTQALWSEVFHAPQSIVDEGQWVDRPSVGLPAMYLFLGVELSEGLRAIGKPAEANDVAAMTSKVARATDEAALFRNLTSAFAPQSAGDSVQGIPLRLDATSQPKVQSSDPAARKPRP